MGHSRSLKEKNERENDVTLLTFKDLYECMKIYELSLQLYWQKIQIIWVNVSILRQYFDHVVSGNIELLFL